MSWKCSRRKFIKKTCVGATGLALGGVAHSPRSALGYVNCDPINPHIDNLRVVYLQDNALTNGTGPVSGWANQNAVTNDAVVAARIDQLARALAEKDDITEAWHTIFLQPPSTTPPYVKPWDQVVVAIKTNNIAEQHTRNAVMKAICELLVSRMGIAPSNIHIFDACNGYDMNTKTPWYGLPSGVRVEMTWGGSTTTVPLPPPYGGTSRCVASIANGTVDILVNIALCKGHDALYGRFTGCCKNHFGTLRPVHDTNYLLSINKCEAVLGAMDPGTGRIIYPRQQLCLVDSLWASSWGPSGQPSHRPNMFFMGTFGPVVDYQMETKFRRDAMGWPINTTVTDRFLTEFGYVPGDLPNGGDMIDALAWTPPQPSLGAEPRWGMYK